MASPWATEPLGEVAIGVRLQISGGAHPRHARNLGVPEPQTTATATALSRHTISLHGSRIVLPILPR